MAVTESHNDRVGSDSVRELIDRHRWLITLGRAGWLAKGIVYVLTGVLAGLVIVDPYEASNEEASPSGAVATIARQPVGATLLYLMAIGLLLYVSWRVVTLVLPADADIEVWITRAGHASSAITYGVLAGTAVSMARNPGSGSSNSGSSEDARVEKVTRHVLEMSGGQLVVGLAGAILVSLGLYFLWHGISRSFESELVDSPASPISRDLVVQLGRIGWIGRATAMVLVGVFIVRTAIQFDPDEARGLDNSLRELADTTPGILLVGVVAVGLLAYGIFCVMSAPMRRPVAADR